MMAKNHRTMVGMGFSMDTESTDEQTPQSVAPAESVAPVQQQAAGADDPLAPPRCPVHGCLMRKWHKGEMWRYYICPEQDCGIIEKRMRPLRQLRGKYGFKRN
jgi:hypothetical protein